MLSLAGGSLVLAGQAQAACSKMTPTRPGEIYLWRGLANVFSLGMDEMGKQFSKMGIENCVYNHSGWNAAAQELVERYRKKEKISYPIVIIGHSLGAGVSPEMATYLAERGIPVSYVVMYDPVVPTQVGGNVKSIVNYFIRKPNKDKNLYAMADFQGTLENIDMSGRRDIDHFNIDKKPDLHKIVYERVLAESDAATAAMTTAQTAKPKKKKNSPR
jgi:thioesterase domain-containing protein